MWVRGIDYNAVEIDSVANVALVKRLVDVLALFLVVLSVDCSCRHHGLARTFG